MTSAAALLLASTVPALLGAGRGPLAPELDAALRRLAPGETATVIVRLAPPGSGSPDAAPSGARLGRPGRAGALASALRAEAELAQRDVRRRLELHRARGAVTRLEPLWIVNGLTVTATSEVLRELAARADVTAITPDALDVVPAGGPAEANVAAVRAPEVWALGAAGAGALVAILDTGVDVSHPDLASRWRAGPGGWLDPYGQHASPFDPSGHGTWTAGVVVGGDAGGTSVGIAPGARFIAAKVFPDSGAATATAIHRAFQWVLDPDGDPATDDAPQVVNASWAFGSPGCNLEFQADVRALRAAGILPVFAAGNYGPGPGTSASPGNYPESLAVGALDAWETPYFSSSRGPSACGGGQFPSLAAPGVDVWTTDLFSWYLPVSGTSIAAPHVSGAALLLAGAFPGASGTELEAALLAGARDLGAAGPDGDTGRGLVDAYAAYQLLATAPPSRPVAQDDAFATTAETSATFTAPGVLANDHSPSGGALSAELSAPVAHGVLALRPDGGFDYTPAPGFTGGDAFRYRASDAVGTSAEATVTLTVTAPAPPVAAPDAYALAEDGVLALAAPGILVNDGAPSGRALAAALATGPSHGTLALAADGSFTYRPWSNYAGPDAFTYRALDGTLASAPATVTLTVTPVNDAPVAVADTASTRTGSAVTIAVAANDLDVDGTVVAASTALVTAPLHGTAVKDSLGRFRYTPARRFRGTDTFTYRVRDDAGAWSAAATVTVEVQ